MDSGIYTHYYLRNDWRYLDIKKISLIGLYFLPSPLPRQLLTMFLHNTSSILFAEEDVFVRVLQTNKQKNKKTEPIGYI